MAALLVAVRKLKEQAAFRDNALTWLEAAEDLNLIVLLRAGGDQPLPELPRLDLAIDERLVFSCTQHGRNRHS